MTRNNILIGSTGYVGDFLYSKGYFDISINSTSPMHSFSTDLLVIAAPGSERWKSEIDPVKFINDHLNVALRFGKINAAKAVLISSIDAYPFTSGYYLDDLNITPQHCYGQSKFILEKLFKISFPNGSIIRLPNIFGGNLKKNIIYDLLKSRRDITLQNNILQWYPLDDIYDDVMHCINNNIQLLFPASCPVSNLDIINAFFPDRKDDLSPGNRFYDIRLAQGNEKSAYNYKFSRDQIMSEIESFISYYRKSN